jgi:stage II sporulation protein P
MEESRMKWFSSTFLLLAASTCCLFIVLSIGGLLQTKMVTSPVSSMRGLTTAVSGPFFVDMLALEVPHLYREESASTFSARNTIEFLFRFVTNINPRDPKTIMASAVPGMGNEFAVLLRTGTVTDGLTSPVEYTPAREFLQPEPTEEETTTDLNATDPEPDEPDEPDAPDTSNEEKEKSPTIFSTNGKKKAFIYHSHNRESWIPELKDKGVTEFSDAFDSQINVTLLGKRLAGRLEDLGIGAVSSDKDYPTAVKGYNWNFSYKYSLKTVQETFAVNPDLEYFFDIHRDAQKKDLTTVTIDGKAYAQVYFIIGHKNPNWEKNEAFANQIHNLMESKYPGISRGVWSKSANSGHAEYNQSFSANSILIEIGGPENTLEESYRTIDILGGAISEIFWDAQKVDAAPTRSEE